MIKRVNKILSSLHEGHLWVGLWALLSVGIMTGAIVGGLSLINR